MSSESFATALNCIDGRTQEPVVHFVKQQTGVQYVDMITKPGIIKILADAGDEALQKAAEISVKGHASKNIFLVAHADCLGNPVQDSEQKKQLQAAKKKIESWGLGTEISTLWVNSDWKVELV